MRSLVVVGVAFDILLLPVAKRDFEHPYGFVLARAEPVLLVGFNPDFFAGLADTLVVAHLDHRTVVDDDPEFSAPGVRLKTQALPGQDGHQANGAILVMGELLE